MKTYSFLLLLALALPATAQQMNYQGRITNDEGVARPGSVTSITFSLWDAAGAGQGTQVWGRS